mgnify:CR=1 FL=1
MPGKKFISPQISDFQTAAISYANSDCNVAISAINMYDRVGLTVESIPEDVISIRLFKEDLVSDSFYSNSENRFKAVVPPDASSSIIEVGKGMTSVYVEDADVIPNKTYRYKCVLRRLRQPEIEANEDLKKLLKSKDIGEDEEKTHEKKVQTITDNHIKSVDEKVSLKEKEIMTI